MSIPEFGITRQEKIEIEELPNGKWQIRQIHVITYDDGQNALHYFEEHLRKKAKENKAVWN